MSRCQHCGAESVLIRKSCPRCFVSLTTETWPLDGITVEEGQIGLVYLMNHQEFPADPRDRWEALAAWRFLAGDKFLTGEEPQLP